MNPDRDLLFGVLAVQAHAIDPARFGGLWLAWSAARDVPLGDWLVREGLIRPEDRAAIAVRVELELKKHRGDVHSSPVDMADEKVRRALDALDEGDSAAGSATVLQSATDGPSAAGPVGAGVATPASAGATTWSARRPGAGSVRFGSPATPRSAGRSR
jgi:hypothetical protein